MMIISPCDINVDAYQLGIHMDVKAVLEIEGPVSNFPIPTEVNDDLDLHCKVITDFAPDLHQTQISISGPFTYALECTYLEIQILDVGYEEDL